MGKDAIIALGRQAAYQQLGLEKTAFWGALGRGLAGAAKFGGRFGTGMARGAAQPVAGAIQGAQSGAGVIPGMMRGMGSAMSAGGRGMGVARTGGALAGMGLAGMAGKDAFQGATGGWSGTNNQDWRNEMATGQAGYGQMAKSWAMNPLQSAMSLFQGQAGKTPYIDQGAGQSGSFNPSTGKMEYAATTGTPTWSPMMDYKKQQYDALQQRHNALKAQQSAEIDRVDKSDPWSWKPWQTRGQLDQQKSQAMAQARKDYDAGNYRKHWWNPLEATAGGIKEQKDALEKDLMVAGRLQPHGAYSPVNMPTMGTGPSRPIAGGYNWSDLLYGY